MEINEQDLIPVFVVNCRNGTQANGVFTDPEPAKKYAASSGSVMYLGKHEIRQILEANGIKIIKEY